METTRRQPQIAHINDVTPGGDFAGSGGFSMMIVGAQPRAGATLRSRRADASIFGVLRCKWPIAGEARSSRRSAASNNENVVVRNRGVVVDIRDQHLGSRARTVRIVIELAGSLIVENSRIRAGGI
jgi:hypothetical protein